MNSLIVFGAYAAAFVFALLLLYRLRTLSWRWHVVSLAAALAVGLMPPLEGFAGPRYDLLVGVAFIILFVWGLGAPLFHHRRQAIH